MSFVPCVVAIWAVSWQISVRNITLFRFYLRATRRLMTGDRTSAALHRQRQPRRIATLLQKRVGALLITPDNLFAARRVQIITLAARHAVPVMHPGRRCRSRRA